MQRIQHYLSNIGESKPIEIERGWRIVSMSTMLVREPMSKIERQAFEFLMKAKQDRSLTDAQIVEVFNLVAKETKDKSYDPIERVLTTVVMENIL